MIISMTTQDGCFFKAHEGRAEAVEYLIESVGPDRQDDFWASEDGQKIEQSSRCFDFSVLIFDTTEAAVKAIAALDPYALPQTLQALAQAIQDGIESGLED